jgi:hypothetical protein
MDELEQVAQLTTEKPMPLSDHQHSELIKFSKRERECFSVERRMASGNYIGFACGPLKRPRYINERIEQELVEFKQEIEDRFLESDVNKTFKFPRSKQIELKQIQDESN